MLDKKERIIITLAISTSAIMLIARTLAGSLIYLSKNITNNPAVIPRAIPPRISHRGKTIL